MMKKSVIVLLAVMMMYAPLYLVNAKDKCCNKSTCKCSDSTKDKCGCNVGCCKGANCQYGASSCGCGK